MSMKFLSILSLGVVLLSPQAFASEEDSNEQPSNERPSVVLNQTQQPKEQDKLSKTFSHQLALVDPIQSQEVKEDLLKSQIDMQPLQKTSSTIQTDLLEEENEPQKKRTNNVIVKNAEDAFNNFKTLVELFNFQDQNSINASNALLTYLQKAAENEKEIRQKYTFPHYQE